MTASNKGLPQQLEKTAMQEEMAATRGELTDMTRNLLDKQQETTATSTNSKARRADSNATRNTSK